MHSQTHIYIKTISEMNFWTCPNISSWLSRNVPCLFVKGEKMVREMTDSYHLRFPSQFSIFFTLRRLRQLRRVWIMISVKFIKHLGQVIFQYITFLVVIYKIFIIYCCNLYGNSNISVICEYYENFD